MDVFINSAEQISVQQPLSEKWFDMPVWHNRTYVRAIEPDYKTLLAPNMARRTGNILKRAIATSREVVKQSGIKMPDAIIGGTGLGCIENTELFLDAMVRNGEELLSPTHFMQSTHNTISSLVAIDLKCHGYNSTYVHKGISFESALQDAYLQFCQGKINTALVGGYDEMTPSYFLLLSRIGYWRVDSEAEPLKRDEEAFAGETSVSFMLCSKKNDKSMACIEGIELMYKPSPELLQQTLNSLFSQNNCTLDDIDAIVVGMSGNSKNDEVYLRTAARLFPDKPLVGYKHIFGESYTASSLGMYAAAVCLQKGKISCAMLDFRHSISDRNNRTSDIENCISRLLIYNHFEDKNHSFILLSKC